LLENKFSDLEREKSVKVELYFAVLTESLNEIYNLRFLTNIPIVDPFFEQFGKPTPNSSLVFFS
jgi:hypothetical protein